MAQPAIDHRRATAERNLAAILDATERLLARHAAVSISAVASEAGLSRPTVYAHFATLEALLEAVAERAVERASAALAAAEPNAGPPLEALDRVIEVSWRELERHKSTSRAAAEQLSPEAMRRSHDAARRPIRKLIDRGRRAGDFRTDVTPDWLATSAIALMHAAVDEVRAGRMTGNAAGKALRASIRDLWIGRPSSD